MVRVPKSRGRIGARDDCRDGRRWSRIGQTRGGDRMATVSPRETSLWEEVRRRKPVTVMTDETGTDTGTGELSRSIGLFQLSMFGIGATIGTGIFIVLTAAVPVAGPAVIVSFVFAGVVAGL